MRILHIENRFDPSLGYQLNFFAKYHHPGIEFHILTSNLSFNKNELYKNEAADRKFETDYKVKIHRLQVENIATSKHNLILKGLKNTILEINPDIIYLHGVEMATAFRVILSRLTSKYKVVADTHTLLNQFGTSFNQKAYLWLLKNILGKAINKKNIHVFYTAEENGQILKSLYGIKQELIHPCFIGTDLSQYYYDDEAGKKLKAESGIAENSKVILYAGKLNAAKKPHLLLQAIKSIENQIKDPVTVLFVGKKDSGYFEKEFNVSISNQLVTVKYIDQVRASELYKYYSMSYMAVFPAENTLSSLDTQACRLPVIMDDEETNRLRLKAGGLVFTKGDVSDLGTKILDLLGDTTLRKHLSEGGYNFIVQHYDYRVIIRNLELFLEKELDSNR